MRDYDEYAGGRPVRVVRKSGFFGKFIAFFLGIIIGVAGFVAGLVGGGYYLAAQMKIKDAFDTVNGYLDDDIDYTKYIDGSYGEKTVVDLVGDLFGAVDEISNASGTLNTLNSVIPLVSQLIVGDKTGETPVDGLVDILEDYGIHVDGAKLMGKVVVKPEGAEEDPETYLMDYLMSCVNEITVGDLFLQLGYPLNDILMAICYGVLNEDYVIGSDGKPEMLDGKKALTIGGFLSADLEEKLFGLPVDALLPIDTTNAVLAMLVYGKPYRYDATTSPVTMKQVTYRGDLSTLTLTDMDGKNVPLTAGSTKLGDNTGKAKIVIDLGEGKTETQYIQYNVTDQLFYAYKQYDETTQTLSVPRKYDKTTINDLTTDIMDKVMDLTLDDIFVGDNKITEGDILYSLKNIPIKELSDKINELTVLDLMPNITKADTILWVLKDIPLNELATKAEETIFNLPIDELLTVRTDDALMKALAYGKENRYVISNDPNDSSKKIVTMKQVQYTATISGEAITELYDIDGESVTFNNATYLGNNIYSVKINDQTQYLKNINGTLFAYTAQTCADGEKITYPKTTINDLQTGDIMDKVMCLKLSDVIKDIDESDTLLYPIKDTLIGDLESEAQQKIFGMSIDELISVNVDDAIMAMLVYGSKTRYDVSNDPNDSSKKIVTMKQVQYTATISGEAITELYDIDGEKVSNPNATYLGNNIYSVKINDQTQYLKNINGTFYAYTAQTCADDEKITYPKTTINDLQTADIKSKMMGLILGDVITIETNPEATEGYNAILAKLAGKKISDLNADTLKGIIDGTQLKEVITIVETEGEEGYNKLLATLGGYTIGELPSKINGIALGDVIDPNGNKILQYLINEGATVSDVSSVIADMKIGSIITVPNEGEDGYKIMSKLAEVKVTELSASTINTIIDDLQLKDVITIVETKGEKDYNAVLAGLAEKKISELNASTLKDVIDGLYLPDVMDIGTSPIFAKLSDVPIGKLKDKIGEKILTLKLKDILTINDPDSNQILYNLQETEIKDLSETINNMPIKDLIPHASEEKILNHLPEGTTLANFSEALHDMSINEVLEEDIYFSTKDEKGNVVWLNEDNKTPLEDQTQRVIKPLWWYMLYSNEVYDPVSETYSTTHYDEATQTVVPNEYGIQNFPMETGMPKLVGNMQNNIKRVSLQKLYNDGMISLDEDGVDMLDDKIVKTFPTISYKENPLDPANPIPEIGTTTIEDDFGGATVYGDLTIEQFMSYVSRILKSFQPQTVTTE